MKALDEVHYKWKMLGTALGVDRKTLHSIEVQGPTIDLSSRMTEGLSAWFEMEEKGHTWEHVCKAVEDNDNNRLANELRLKYEKELEGECYT